MKIGIDAGYGFVKAIAENGRRVSFPSVVGAGRERPMAGLFGRGDGPGHDVSIRLGAEPERYFLGELALRESWNASRSFEQERVNHPGLRTLLLAAAAMLNEGGEPVHLATGLPLEYYFSQREALKGSLQGLTAEVTLHRTEERRLIHFQTVTLFPQAAGAFYAQLLDESGAVRNAALAEAGGLVAVLDIGFKTSDFLVLDLDQGLAVQESMSGTINLGMSVVYEGLQRELKLKTGEVIDLLEVELAAQRKRALFWLGREWNLADMLRPRYVELGRAIRDKVMRAWGDKASRIRVIYLAGGGAYALEQYLPFSAATHMAEDAQFANAKGFLAVAAARERGGQVA